MRKIIAGINMTIDGYCDHTAMIADEELHRHFTALLQSADTLLYGRITYLLMENYWPMVVQEPTGDQATDEFAVAIENISKIVFSKTMDQVNWKSARLATAGLSEEVTALRQQPGGDILVGSRSLIVALLNMQLIDELQLCIHPVIAGGGLPLFEHIRDRILPKLVKTKTFGSGTVVMYYEV
jgi:dihydrofolate reductase